jgi:N-acetyl-gamma-glutamyl-phosphate reductase
LHRAEIAEAALGGNPGCFAVSSILGAAPAARHGLVDPASIICDAKTGVSGAGIKPAQTFHYPLRYENMNAYKIAAHQHNFEIECELSAQAGTDIRVTLTTQVVPLCRGIMTIVYGQLSKSQSARDVYDAYFEFYRQSPFVRVEPMGTPTSNNDVRGSNQCVLSVNVDQRTGRMIVVSHIDNLMKGQAGSALQNMNVMFGLDETLGLRRPPFYP